jgi:hypothetical protein
LCVAAGISARGPAQAGEILNMTANGWFQMGLFVAAIFLITKPLGIFLVHVFERKKQFWIPSFAPWRNSFIASRG